MFQLENELRAWRTRFDRLESMREQDVEELEQHIRDSVAKLTSQGLSEEEAFLVATHRIGKPTTIGSEYGKINGYHIWSQRLFWMLAGFIFFSVAQLAISTAASLGLTLAALVSGNGHVMGSLSVGITALCWLGLAIACYRRSANHHDVSMVGRFFAQSRAAVIGTGVVLVVVISAILKLVSQVTLQQLVPIETIGEAARIASPGQTVFTLLIPAAILVALLAIRARLHGEAAVS